MLSKNKALKVSVGIALGAVSLAMLAATDYITVNGSGVDVSPNLATDVGHQLLNWVGQWINIVFSFIVPLLGILIMLAFLYGIYKLVVHFARKKGA